MNKKMISQLSAALILTGVVACSGSSETAKVEAKAEKDPNLCYYPGSEVRAADWICSQKADGYALSAVGIHRKTKGGVSTARNLALLNGRNEISRQLKIKVSGLIQNSLETAGIDDKETVDTATKDVAEGINVGKLSGSRAIMYKDGPDGTTYALVVLDNEVAAKVAKEAIATSLNNKEALYQKFLLNKNIDDLRAQAEKMAESEFQ